MHLRPRHLLPDTGPVLVREGFSWGAFFFGPLWLLAHRAWIAAALDLAAGVLVGGLAGGGLGIALWAALAVLQGLFGRDLVRWSLDLRGYTLVHVIAARDAEAAFGRLLQSRPDLAVPLAAAAGLRS